VLALVPGETRDGGQGSICPRLPHVLFAPTFVRETSFYSAIETSSVCGVFACCQKLTGSGGGQKEQPWTDTVKRRAQLKNAAPAVKLVKSPIPPLSNFICAIARLG
jgi:hypothetical protein